MPLPRKPTQARASFDPDNFSTGTSLADGDYTIVSCTTGLFTFGAFGDHAAFLVTYQDADGVDHLVPYKAGDNKYILPSDDGEGFEVGPDAKSETPQIYKPGDASRWLQSWKAAGYKFTSDEASQFNGIRVRLVSEAIPRGKGTDKENPNKTIQLIAKILGTQGKPSAPARPTARTTGAKSAASAAASSRTAPATSASNGELNDAAIALVMQVLEKAADQTMPIPKLAMGVYMAAQKDADYKPNASAIKKLITPEWLASQEGIEADDDNAALAS